MLYLYIIYTIYLYIPLYIGGHMKKVAGQFFPTVGWTKKKHIEGSSKDILQYISNSIFKLISVAWDNQVGWLVAIE